VTLTAEEMARRLPASSRIGGRHGSLLLSGSCNSDEIFPLVEGRRSSAAVSLNEAQARELIEQLRQRVSSPYR